MSLERRQVRATLDFFRDLDRQFRSDRGPNGEPDAGDFQTFELLNIVETFAERFDDMPLLIPGRSDYRVEPTNG